MFDGVAQEVAEDLFDRVLLVDLDFAGVVFEDECQGMLKACGEFFDVRLKARKDPTERDHGQGTYTLCKMFVEFAQVLDDLLSLVVGCGGFGFSGECAGCVGRRVYVGGV